MTKEEKLLSDKYGKDPGFMVPKGYFEDFADRMMAQIPENSTAKVVITLECIPWLKRFK